MSKSTRYSPEVRDRAVRMVWEHQDEYESRWAAIVSIGAQIGCTAETLRKWVHKAEREQRLDQALSADERERLKALERENRELRRANEILRQAAAFFAQAELDRHGKGCWPLSISIVSATGSSRSVPCCRSPRPPTIGIRPARSIRSACRDAPNATPS